MAIDYIAESEKYRPQAIRTLLVCEAPPPSGKTYFYVPRAMSDRLPIERDKSLPATIFNHYFQQRPTTIEQYISFLTRLKEQGIFMIDICDEPVKVRGCLSGVARIIREIPKLRSKMVDRGIHVADKDIVFLLARKNYTKHIHREFPNSRQVTWKDFRLNPESPGDNCD